MNEANLENKVRELVEELGGDSELGRGKLSQLARQVQNNHKKLEKSVNSLQESLDYLRICIKYQLFDLEATRRENKYLKNLLEEKNR